MASGWPQCGQRLAGPDEAQIGPLVHLDVARDVNVAEMESVFVRAGGHAGRALQGFIGMDGSIFYAYGAKAAGMGVKHRKNFLRLGGAEVAVSRNAPVSLASLS